MADQFPNISPYAYGNNNPLRFTDPTGMAPLDDYGFDVETGQLSLIRETNDDFDVIYLGNFKKDGNFMKDGEFIQINKGALQGKYFDDISKSGLVFRDMSEGLQTMKYLSFNSYLEFNAWAFKDGTQEGLAISPWEGNTYKLSYDYYSNTERVGYLGEKLFNIHTHPSNREDYGYGWPSPGDIRAIKLNLTYPYYILSQRQEITRYYFNGNTFTVTDLDRYFK